MVKEIEGSRGGLGAELDDCGTWGGDISSAMSAAEGVSPVFGASFGAADGWDVAVMDEADGTREARLAIARPKPPTTVSGSENSASQCSPVTQLNSCMPP